MNKPNPKARRIVAMLLWRERRALHHLLRAIKANKPEIVIAAYNSYWESNHNAAQSAKRILYDED